MGVHHALRARCACAVQKVGWFGPISPGGPGAHAQHCSLVMQPKNPDNVLKQRIFPTTNARLLSESAVFALWA